MNSYNIYKKTINSPIGELVIAASQKGICLLEFSGLARTDEQLLRIEKRFLCSLQYGSSVFFDNVRQQLEAYFKGKLTTFDVPVDLRGTDFQCQVWQSLLDIPYGETISYQQQAININKPKAVRAVANANRLNPIGIIIPCHRVIGKSGALTGYGGGLDRKRFLLDLERLA